jgi:hypothetical protein
MIESTVATSAGFAAGAAGIGAGVAVVTGGSGFCAGVLPGCGFGVLVWAMIVLVAQQRIKNARTKLSGFTAVLLMSNQ